MLRKNNTNKKLRHSHSKLARWWWRYEFKHTTFALLTVAVFIVALDTAIVQGSMTYIQEMGIAGLVIAGVLFTSFFTAAPAVLILLTMAEAYDPLIVAFYAAAGSVIGDWIILKIFEERIAYELLPLAKKFHLRGVIRSVRRKKNREKATILGMVVIASPLPDELGIGLLGIAHLPTISLLVITFLLNAAGILVLVLAI